jgi:hypothetical protein
LQAVYGSSGASHPHFHPIELRRSRRLEEGAREMRGRAEEVRCPLAREDVLLLSALHSAEEQRHPEEPIVAGKRR